MLCLFVFSFYKLIYVFPYISFFHELVLCCFVTLNALVQLYLVGRVYLKLKFHLFTTHLCVDGSFGDIFLSTNSFMEGKTARFHPMPQQWKAVVRKTKHVSIMLGGVIYVSGRFDSAIYHENAT